MDVAMLWNFYSEDFLFTISGYDMVLTRDLDRKIASCQRLQHQNQKFLTFD